MFKLFTYLLNQLLRRITPAHDLSLRHLEYSILISNKFLTTDSNRVVNWGIAFFFVQSRLYCTEQLYWCYQEPMMEWNTPTIEAACSRHSAAACSARMHSSPSADDQYPRPSFFATRRGPAISLGWVATDTAAHGAYSAISPIISIGTRRLTLLTHKRQQSYICPVISTETHPYAGFHSRRMGANIRLSGL